MKQLTGEVLQEIVPGLDPDKAQMVADSLLPAMAWAEINTFERITAFLAQCAHESQGFTRLSENLNYSAQGLMKTFGKYFTWEQAQDYARQPERIANRVYANRMGNGNEASGDGWKFRGHGWIQLTGCSNHTRAGIALGLDLVNNPEMAASPQGGAYVSAWFWNDRNLNQYADAGDFVTMTRRINGGLTGLSDRERLWGLAQAALSEA